MEYVNVRKLQRDFNKVLEELPVTVTKNGVPVCVVLSPNISTTLNPSEEKVVQEASKIADKILEEPKPITPIHFCEMPMCRKESIGTGEIFNTETGEPQEVFLCQSHFNAYLREAGING